MQKAELKYLIEQTQAKNSEAFGRIYDFYYPKLVNYIYRRVLNVELTGDIAANTFFKILENISKFTWNKSENELKMGGFEAWMYRIATNEINLYYRKQNKYEFAIDEKLEIYFQDYDLHEQSVEEELICKEEFLVLNKAIKKLKPIYQDILHLKYFEDLSYKDISHTLKRNESTVRVYLQRALEELKLLLEADAKEFLIKI
jgi:RNA polymerase sigma-70 factor (ECF subfamily)